MATMGDPPAISLTVTWMHGQQVKTYRVQNWEVENGNLWLTPPSDAPQPAVCIPLVNVQLFTIG